MATTHGIFIWTGLSTLAIFITTAYLYLLREFIKRNIKSIFIYSTIMATIVTIVLAVIAFDIHPQFDAYTLSLNTFNSIPWDVNWYMLAVPVMLLWLRKKRRSTH